MLECCERKVPSPVSASVSGLVKPIFSVGSVKTKSSVLLGAALEKNIYQAGSEVFIQVHVKNQSKKQIKGITLSLKRKILILKSELGQDVSTDEFSNLKVIDERIASQVYKSIRFDAGEERTITLHMNTPVSTPLTLSIANTSKCS